MSDDDPQGAGTSRDIAAEERVRESARRLAEAQALANIGSWEWELGQERLIWSDELCRIFGQPVGFSPTYAEFLALVHPDDRDRLSDAVAEARRGGLSDCEYRIMRPDGEARTVLGRRYGRADASGQIVTLFGTDQDITELRAAQQAGREAQELFETAFQDAPIGIALVALDGTWLKVNRTLCTILGWTESELLERTFQDLTHPDDLGADLELVHQLLTGEIGAYQMEKRYLRRSGAAIWAHLSVSLVRHPDGTPRHFISQIKDISERRAEHTALREAQARVEAIFDHVPAGMTLRGLDGRYELVNQAAAHSVGKAASALIGSYPQDALDPDTGARMRSEDAEMIRTREPIVRDFVLAHPDGTEHHYHVVRYPVLGADDEVIGFGSFSLDITERQAAEAERERALAQLDEAQRIARVGSWSWETHLAPASWSVEMYRIFGRAPRLGPAAGAEFFTYVHPEDRDRVAAGYSEMFGDAGRFEIDYRIIRDGDEGQQECWLRAHGRRDPDRPGGYIGTVQDVTDLRAAELDAMRQRDYAQAIINSTHEGFLLTRDGEILDVNPALCELTGFSRETLLGARAPYPFWAPETAAQIERHRRKVSAAGSGAVETTFARADGTRVEVAMTTLQGGSGPNGQPAYVTTVRDISAEKRNRAELQVLATRDALTGLLNQRVFHEQLRDEIARAERHGRPLSIAIFDLDHFKAINDRHGHPTGDAVLRDVARRLQSLVRDGEHLARIGGEEFARILPDATGIGAFAAAERTRRAISAEPFPGVGTLTLSAGVCELAEAGSLERLYEYADRALYAAKQQGRDRTIRYAVQTAADYDRSCIGT